MAFTLTFPIDTGTFVIVDHKGVDLSESKNLLGRLGSISCYQCVDKRCGDPDYYIVMVSGYKDSWCGEYLTKDLLIATDEQVKMYEEEMGIE